MELNQRHGDSSAKYKEPVRFKVYTRIGDRRVLQLWWGKDCATKVSAAAIQVWTRSLNTTEEGAEVWKDCVVTIRKFPPPQTVKIYTRAEKLNNVCWLMLTRSNCSESPPKIQNFTLPWTFHPPGSLQLCERMLAPVKERLWMMWPF